MSKEKNQILNHDEVIKKLQRITHQIIEDNFNEKNLVLVGISKNGFSLAKYFAEKLSNQFNISLIELKINKKKPAIHNIELAPAENLESRKVILIDDVLNTGKTLMHAASCLTSMQISGMKTIALIDRRHRSFPIKADWAGLTLSTTLQEHISVEIINGKYQVFLV